MADLHAYAASLTETPRVGDAIRQFHATCGTAYCEGCGKADVSAGQCKGCHVAKYCTVACQQRDWKDGGHAVECQAIVRNDLFTQHGVTSESLVPLRHFVRCSARALVDGVDEQTDKDQTNPVTMARTQLAVESLIGDSTKLEHIGRNWMAGAVKHPGSFTRAAARADKGKYKGRTTAFAHHVLANKDHKHNSGLLRKRASLALTFARFRRHGRSK